MSMVSAGDFKNGLTFEMNGSVMQVIEFQHVKPGKGSAFVRTKFKNLITGAILEKSFNPNEKFPLAYIEKKNVQFSYSDGDLKNFLDLESYEFISVDESKLGDGFKFIKEEMKLKMLFYNGKVLGVELPNFVELEVVESEPGVKGNTATNATKPVTLSTGAQIRVPLFVHEGNVVRIDTRTGEYIERISSN